jgi:methyl-accepting chemotaxis protein
MIKLKNISFKSKLLLIVIPLIGISLILLLTTSTFLNGFSSKISSLGSEELVNQKRQTLLLETKNVMMEANMLQYFAKDAITKLALKEDQAAENYLNQLEIVSGKVSNVAGQLISLNKENESKLLTSDYQALSAILKNWGIDINLKKITSDEAANEFKKNRKLLKTFVKERATFDDNITSTTPEMLAYVNKEKTNFRYKAIAFVLLIICIAILSFYIIVGLVRFEAESAKNMIAAVRSFNMVENFSLPTMSSDLDGKVLSINKAGLDNFNKLKNHLPVQPESIIGSSIYSIHKNPDLVKKISTDPKNLPYSSTITLGPEKLSLIVSAIVDHDGKFQGPMVTWQVVTEKVALIEDLTKASNELAISATNVLNISTNLSAAAEETSAQANTASVAAEEVNSGVQTVASSMEEMVSAIKEITRTTNEASMMTSEAMTKAKSTNAIINKLGASSIDIGNVIKVISSIAQQTNLLALNATIEAARAGEAGKGFAVVANEVKELANQTAKATNEITQKIEAIQSDSNSAMAAIAEITISIEKVHGFNSNIAAAVEEQAATTNDVKRIVTDAATGVTQINENILQVSQAASNTGKDAHKSEEAAKSVNAIVTKLNASVLSLKT